MRTHFYIFICTVVIIVEDVIRSEYDTGTSQFSMATIISQKLYWCAAKWRWKCHIEFQRYTWRPSSLVATFHFCHIFFDSNSCLSNSSDGFFFGAISSIFVCLVFVFSFFVPILSNLFPFIYAMKIALKCPLRHHFIGAIVCTTSTAATTNRIIPHYTQCFGWNDSNSSSDE